MIFCNYRTNCGQPRIRLRNNRTRRLTSGLTPASAVANPGLLWDHSSLLVENGCCGMTPESAATVRKGTCFWEFMIWQRTEMTFKSESAGRTESGKTENNTRIIKSSEESIVRTLRRRRPTEFRDPCSTALLQGSMRQTSQVVRPGHEGLEWRIASPSISHFSQARA